MRAQQCRSSTNENAGYISIKDNPGDGKKILDSIDNPKPNPPKPNPSSPPPQSSSKDQGWFN